MIPHNRFKPRYGDGWAIRDVVNSGQIGQGPHVEAFEDELVERFRPGGAAACVSSGTAALRLAVIALGLEEVTLPTYACTALYHAVNDGVSRVKFVDCAPWTLCSRAASVVVHTYGNPGAVLGPVEDFTHAVGGSYDGHVCGSMGQASVISFGATKPLGAGVGGAVLGEAALIEAIRDMRDYDGKRELRTRFNWQLGDMTAALGRRRLARLDEENDWRKATAERYAEVCRANGIDIYASAASTFYRFVIRVPDVEKARQNFAGHGIETLCPLERWELLHVQVGTFSDYPNAEDAARHALSLPIWPGMAEADVACVVEALKGLA